MSEVYKSFSATMPNRPKAPSGSFDLKGAFAQADKIYASIEQLLDNESTDSIELIAWNLAFAIEIYLKCLIAIELGQPKSGHNFSKLLENLKSETMGKLSDMMQSKLQDEIANHGLGALIKGIPGAETMYVFDFGATLGLASSAFVDWRYSFEGVDTPLLCPVEIIQSLRECIMEVEPKLKNERKYQGHRFYVFTEAYNQWIKGDLNKYHGEIVVAKVQVS